MEGEGGEGEMAPETKKWENINKTRENDMKILTNYLKKKAKWRINALLHILPGSGTGVEKMIKKVFAG